MTSDYTHFNREEKVMKKLKLLIFMSWVMAVAVLSWGVDQAWAQQAPAAAPQSQQKLTNFEKLQNELAARRAAQGQMKSTTPSQRKAAAQRLKALLEAQKKKSAPNPGGEVNK